MAGETEGSVESCKHGCLGSRTARGGCDVWVWEGVRGLYVVFALPNLVVRDTPCLGRSPTFAYCICSVAGLDRRSGC